MYDMVYNRSGKRQGVREKHIGQGDVDSLACLSVFPCTEGQSALRQGDQAV